MKYHLNLYRASDRNKEINFGELLKEIRKVYPNTSIGDATNTIKQLNIKNHKIGTLFITKNNFWSYYENNKQLKELSKFALSLGFVLEGEEGEIYSYLDEDNGFISTPKKVSSESTIVKLVSVIKSRWLGLLMILAFLLVAWFAS